jgi:hypothetical protein
MATRSAFREVRMTRTVDEPKRINDVVSPSLSRRVAWPPLGASCTTQRVDFRLTKRGDACGLSGRRNRGARTARESPVPAPIRGGSRSVPRSSNSGNFPHARRANCCASFRVSRLRPGRRARCIPRHDWRTVPLPSDRSRLSAVVRSERVAPKMQTI